MCCETTRTKLVSRTKSPPNTPASSCGARLSSVILLCFLGYLAYFCKAGDGVVDLQLISDLHKSEVKKVAKTLGVRIPVGCSKELNSGGSNHPRLGPNESVVQVCCLLNRKLGGYTLRLI